MSLDKHVQTTFPSMKAVYDCSHYKKESCRKKSFESEEKHAHFAKPCTHAISGLDFFLMRPFPFGVRNEWADI